MNSTGTLTLSVNNTYTGPTIVNSGILTLAQANATIATNSAGLTINGGAVQVTATNALAFSATAEPVTINNGGVLETGSGAAVDSWIGGLTLSGGTLSGLGTSNPAWGNWQMGGTVTVTAGTGDISTISAASITEQQTGGLVFNVGQSGAAGGVDLLVSSAIIQGTSAGSTGLVKTGLGTMALSGANTYTSQTSIQQGTLRVNAGGTLGATTAPATMGTGTAGTLGTVSNLTINTGTQIGSLSVVSNTSNTTTATNIGQLSIASGSTLTLLSFSVGVAPSATAGTNTALGTGTPQSGAGGTLAVNGNVTIGVTSGTAAFAANVATDLSGLSNFNVTSTTAGFLNVGCGQEDNSSLTLAANNTINVTTLSVGDSTQGGGSSNASGNPTLNLGSGTNVLDANTIVIGQAKGVGTVQFAGAMGSLTIAGLNGTGTANITMANGNNSGTASSGTSKLLLAGHAANVAAGTVVVGEETNAGNGTPNAEITFDTGTFTAANLEIALDTGGNSTNGAIGSFILGTSPSSTGTLTVNTSFILADNTNTHLGNAQGSFTINGGTANINTNIIVPSTQGTSTTTLTLNGGTLNMNGFAIGGSGTGAITNLNFESGTLENVGEINGGAVLNKTTSGTLILAGAANSYIGGTTISGGTLVAANTSSSGSATGSGPVMVGNGASLFGTLAGSIAAGQGFITGPVTVNSGSTLAAGNAANAPAVSNATLTLSGGLTLAGGSIADLGLNTSAPNGTSNPLVDVSGGVLTVNGPATVNIAFSGNAAGGQTYDLFGYGANSSGFGGANAAGTTIGNLSLSGAPPSGYTYSLVNNSAGSQIDLVITALVTWSGSASNAWDTASSNWASGSPATAATYADGDQVVFADINPLSGTNVTNTSLAVQSTGVNPASVTFTNTGSANGGVDYTLSNASGSIGISGSTGVTLAGSSGSGGTVTFNSPNTYTGRTTINAGTLILGNSNAVQNSTVNVNVSGGLQFAAGLARPISVAWPAAATSRFWTTPLRLRAQWR